MIATARTPPSHARPHCALRPASAPEHATHRAPTPRRVADAGWLRSRCACRRPSGVSLPLLRGSKQDEVVAVNDFVATAPAENRLDLIRAMTGDAFGIDAGVGRETTRQCLAGGIAYNDRIAALECAVDRAYARRQQRTTCGKRACGAGIHQECAKWRQRARYPTLARGATVGCGEKPCAARTRLERGKRTLSMAIGDRHRAASLRGDTRRDQLRLHAAGGITGRWLATHCLDLRRYGGNDRYVHRSVIAPRIGGVQAVDVGQQHKLVGLHHLRDARGETIVVTEADLGSRHGVVLVDYRDAADGEQRVERGARVEIAA